MAEEKQRTSAEVLEPLCDLFVRGGVLLAQRQCDERLIGLTFARGGRKRPYIALDREGLSPGMDFRAIGEGVDRLEAYAEAPDCREVLRALVDAADALHIGLVEGLPEMRHPQLFRREVKIHGVGAFPAIATPQRILGIL
jgi:hypothetical protein